jgi:hypothetical protein
MSAWTSQGVLKGAAGINGINAFTTLSAAFTMPSVGSTVVITVASNVWLNVGQYVNINGNCMLVSAINPNTFGLTLLNPSPAVGGNVAAGTSVPINSVVSPDGVPGINGTNGTNGTNGVRGTKYQGNFANFAALPTIDGVNVITGDLALTTDTYTLYAVV